MLEKMTLVEKYQKPDYLLNYQIDQILSQKFDF